MVVTVTNGTGRPLSDVRVTIPLPEGVVFESLQTEGDVTDLSTPEDTSGAVTLAFPRLGAGESRRLALEARSPWRHGVLRVTGLRVDAAEWPLSAHGPYATLRVENGAVPIGVAHALVGQEVTVEGVATMFTGGFYAGSTGTKFYLQDDTGGIQVYCPGAKGKVRVRIGDRLQVTGKVEVYRDSLEIVSDTCADDVHVLGHGEQLPEPLALTAREAQGGERYAGSLVEVAGTVTRFEEFNYSYEVDLLDGPGIPCWSTWRKRRASNRNSWRWGTPTGSSASSRSMTVSGSSSRGYPMTSSVSIPPSSRWRCRGPSASRRAPPSLIP